MLFNFQSTHSEGEELAANSFKWEIPNFHRRIISSTFPHEITSAASWFPALGCQMKFTIYFQNASMFFFAAQYEKPYPDESNPFNYCHKITFKVLDFANDMNLIRVIEPRFKDKYATERTSKKALDSVEVDILHSTSGYLQNGKIVIHVIVESLNTLIKDLPYRHGTMVWRIENFYDNIRSCHNGISIKSNYFYSSKYGYRMQISLYTTVNRSLQQTYITFALRFLKGEFDKNLTTIYPHRTSITIVNKKFGGSRNILKQEESKMVDDDCFPSVVSIFDLESQGFLENDMLVVSVNVISLDGRVF